MGKKAIPRPPGKNLPSYMIGDAGKGFDNLEPDDVPWIGIDETLDPERILLDNNYDPDPALELLLLSIIDAHPNVKPRHVRLEIALFALTGERRKHGMDTKDDYELLQKIAWEFLVTHWKDPRYEPEVGPIAKRVLENLPANDPRRPGAEIASAVRRLERKFNKQRDVLLVRESSQMDEGRMDRIRSICEVAKAMAALGISVDLKAVTPRVAQRDSIPPE